MSEALIAATGVSVTFGSGAHRVDAVRNVSLTLGAGEAIAHDSVVDVVGRAVTDEAAFLAAGLAAGPTV